MDDIVFRAAMWRSIETFTPVNGVANEVLGFTPNIGVERLRWVGNRRDHLQGWWATVPGRWSRNPTHWMPLPEAPK